MDWAHPVLSCKDAAAWEQRVLIGENAEWQAMLRAGKGVADALARDALEFGGLAKNARLLVLAGKGHNGGDALIAARALLEKNPGATVSVVFAFGERALRPLSFRAWTELLATAPNRIELLSLRQLRERMSSDEPWDICLDGILGIQFRPPLSEATAELIRCVNEHEHFKLRVAVDLPSGLGEINASSVFRADFTYATGITKAPVLAPENANHVGRVRIIDIGLFRSTEPPLVHEHNLTPHALDGLLRPRSTQSDKRTFGRVLIVAGSRQFPGAALMATQAALRSGVGLVTAVIPESLHAAFAAKAPEAIWIGAPETPEGSLALDALSDLRTVLREVHTVVIGPGIGASLETLALVREFLREAQCPVVLDADALQQSLLDFIDVRTEQPVVITPHAGEFARLRGQMADVVSNAELIEYARERQLTAVLKGPITRISDGNGVWHSTFGGPVLARGGSGDLLAGLLGGLLAQTCAKAERASSPLSQDAILRAVGAAVAWHGIAADRLAQRRGQTSVAATELLDELPGAVRVGACIH